MGQESCLKCPNYFLKLIHLFIYIIPAPSMGLKLMIPKSRVTRSSDWASQTPEVPQLLSSGEDGNQTCIVWLQWLLLTASKVDQDHLNFKQKEKLLLYFKSGLIEEKPR